MEHVTDGEMRLQQASLLETLPPVEFCCIYGSSLHPNNAYKDSMIDYLLGVADPQQWHTENLKINKNHYAAWMAHLGGARLITQVADNVGVGVHFNPFVSHNDLMFKYGVVRMHDLIQDIMGWERLYLSGRLQKPVNVIVDNLKIKELQTKPNQTYPVNPALRQGLGRVGKIKELNYVNLRSAAAAALLLLPSRFNDEQLYRQICSLSYMGDLRMLFAEDRDKVKKIVQGQYKLFQAIYDPVLKEFEAGDLIRIPSSIDNKSNIVQDCGLSTTRSLVSRLPLPIRKAMALHLGEEKVLDESGQAVRNVVIKTKEEAAGCMQKILRRKVLVSSRRQAVAGLLTVGAVRGFRYLGSKMHKAWRSWQ